MQLKAIATLQLLLSAVAAKAPGAKEFPFAGSVNSPTKYTTSIHATSPGHLSGLSAATVRVEIVDNAGTITIAEQKPYTVIITAALEFGSENAVDPQTVYRWAIWGHNDKAILMASVSAWGDINNATYIALQTSDGTRHANFDIEGSVNITHREDPAPSAPTLDMTGKYLAKPFDGECPTILGVNATIRSDCTGKVGDLDVVLFYVKGSPLDPHSIFMQVGFVYGNADYSCFSIGFFSPSDRVFQAGDVHPRCTPTTAASSDFDNMAAVKAFVDPLNGLEIKFPSIWGPLPTNGTGPLLTSKAPVPSSDTLAF